MSEKDNSKLAAILGPDWEKQINKPKERRIKMRKYIVALTQGERVFWGERQMRICHECGVRIDFHGNPVRMWVMADQDGVKAMSQHKEIEDFVISVEQDKEKKDGATN